MRFTMKLLMLLNSVLAVVATPLVAGAPLDDGGINVLGDTVSHTPRLPSS